MSIRHLLKRRNPWSAAEWDRPSVFSTPSDPLGECREYTRMKMLMMRWIQVGVNSATYFALPDSEAPPSRRGVFGTPPHPPNLHLSGSPETPTSTQPYSPNPDASGSLEALTSAFPSRGCSVHSTCACRDYHWPHSPSAYNIGHGAIQRTGLGVGWALVVGSCASAGIVQSEKLGNGVPDHCGGPTCSPSWHNVRDEPQLRSSLCAYGCVYRWERGGMAA